MSRKCQITGVTKQYGHNVSHANNKTNRVFNSNLQTKRFWVPELKKFIKIKVTTSAIRSIDKIGLMAMLKKHGVSLKSVSPKSVSPKI